jgi:hypothetical protein
LTSYVNLEHKEKLRLQITFFYFNFDPSSRIGISDTNRVERHGGKTMRAMQTKTVQQTAPSPIFLMITGLNLLLKLCYREKF